MSSTRIKILDDIVARQIAAGEVIDRPAAVLRELLDNSIDSESSHIEVSIKNMGLDLIQVSDNGTGMTKEDLLCCPLPHATSKIATHDDLSHITSMGFRGEALPSIAAVSRMSITSKHKEASEAWSIEAHANHISSPIQAARDSGTTVKAERLFQDIPARRSFLSSPQAELNHLKQIFFKKAAAFPDIVFSFQSESQTSTHATITLPKETLLARSIRICSNNITPHDFLFIDEARSTEGQYSFSLSASLGLPHIAQKTRKHIHIYINNRPVKVFSILQAVEYAYKNILHGQKYPQAVIFLSVPPHLLDVNIHPAKTEIKIRSVEPIRKLIISNIEQTLQHIASDIPHITSANTSANNIAGNENNHEQRLPPPALFLDSTKPTDVCNPAESTESTTETTSTVFERTRSYNQNDNQKSTGHQSNTILNHLHAPSQNTNTNPSHWHYLCTIFQTYLLFETSNNEQEQSVIILDFHAAHERILYDALIQKSKPTALLVPIPLTFDTDEETIQSIIEKYRHIGIEIHKHNNGFLLRTIPSQAPIPADDIAALIESHLDIETINAKIFANRACRRAAKAGDFVDREGADTLLKQAMALEHPRCPHGRPLWLQLDKHTLDTMIGRIE